VGADAHVETGLATFRITRRLDMCDYAIDNRYEIDVACESSLYFVDVEKQRKTESAIEVGISISENARLAPGLQMDEISPRGYIRGWSRRKPCLRPVGFRLGNRDLASDS